MEGYVYPYLKAACRIGKRAILPAIVFAITLTLAYAPARSQEVISSRAPMGGFAPTAPKFLPGHLFIPSSNVVSQQDKGKMMHTNVRVYLPDVELISSFAPPYSGYGYETPQSIACMYAVVSVLAGCNPNTAVNTPAGGSETIAIVDAYDSPSAAADLAYFSDQMGLPFGTSQFQVVYAAGFAPSVDYTGGWELEEALDVEWAHAMAPKAMIYLVEANSNYTTDLMAAVQVATNLVRCGKTTTCPTSPAPTGKGEVSMSWGGAEASGETSYDSYFNNPNVVYLAASGDSPGAIYPATSPNVIAVGGTSIARVTTTGNYQQEDVWQETGSGQSLYEAKPAYQAKVAFASKRYTPDVAADGDPETGVWVYDSFPFNLQWGPSNWMVVGGTSAAVQIWAGLLNSASTANGAFAANTSAELTKLYGDASTTTTYAADFKDVTYGNCYFYRGYFAATGIDHCTGLGVAHTYAGK